MSPTGSTPRPRPGAPALLSAASTSARLGRAAGGIAVVLVLLERAVPPASVGLAVAAQGVPALLVGPLLGAVLDRTRHRRALFAGAALLAAAALLGVLLADPEPCATGGAPPRGRSAGLCRTSPRTPGCSTS